MKILYFCQSIDPSDAIVGDTLDRILSLGKQPEVSEISVLTTRGVKRNDLPGITHYSMQRESKGRIASFLFLLTLIFTVFRREKFDWIYLYMVPTRAFLFKLFKPFFGYSIVGWFAHTQFTKWTSFNLKNCLDLWLCVDHSQSFESSNLRVIGQGLNLEHFHRREMDKRWDFVTVGRLTPVKNIELQLRALKEVSSRPTLAIVGEAYMPSDIEYRESLKRLVQELGLESQVTFLGMIGRQELPEVLAQARYFLFTVPGGIGKATIESLGMGLPMIISYPPAKNFFGRKLEGVRFCEANKEAIANEMNSLCSLGEGNYQKLVLENEHFAKENFSMDSFSKRVIEQLMVKN